MVKHTFKGAVIAVQAQIEIKRRFANKVEDPHNPYTNHSETESSSDEDEDIPGSEFPATIVADLEGRRASRVSLPKKPPSALKRYKGMLLALLSSLIFSLGALLVKKLTGYHPFSIAFWRFQGAFLPVLPLIGYKVVFQGHKNKIIQGVWPLSNLKNWGLFSLVLLRSALSCNSLLLHFYSLKYMSMGDALTIASSTPILVALLARIFLKEKCGVVTIVASVFTLIGVVAMTRPPMLTGAAEFDADTLVIKQFLEKKATLEEDALRSLYTLKIEDIVLTPEEIATLEEGKMLYDTILDACIRVRINRAKAKGKKVFAVFSAIFNDTLSISVGNIFPKDVRADLWNYESLFVPIHFTSRFHFALLHVEFPNGKLKITSYDSFGRGDGCKERATVVVHTLNQLRIQQNLPEFTDVDFSTSIDCPQQGMASNDCGVFVIKAIETLLKGEKFTNDTTIAADKDSWRNTFFEEVLNFEKVSRTILQHKTVKADPTNNKTPEIPQSAMEILSTLKCPIVHNSSAIFDVSALNKQFKDKRMFFTDNKSTETPAACHDIGTLIQKK